MHMDAARTWDGRVSTQSTARILKALLAIDRARVPAMKFDVGFMAVVRVWLDYWGVVHRWGRACTERIFFVRLQRLLPEITISPVESDDASSELAVEVEPSLVESIQTALAADFAALVAKVPGAIEGGRAQDVGTCTGIRM
jgi:hypothetical protein